VKYFQVPSVNEIGTSMRPIETSEGLDGERVKLLKNPMFTEV